MIGRWVEKYGRFLAIGLLLLFFWRVWHTVNTQSNTFDEGVHIFSGVWYWQLSRLYSIVQNPPLINALIGLPVKLFLEPALPVADPVWQSLDWWAISNAFLWETNANGLALIAVARLAIVWLALLFGALIYRWSAQLFQARTAGLLALLLFTFDPNILAHSSLATTDLGLAFFMALAAYGVWRYWDGAGKTAVYLLTGLCFGLAFSAKFTALLLIPALGVIFIYRGVNGRFSRRAWIQSGLEAAGWLLLGVLVLLLSYRLQWAPLLADYQWQQSHQLAGHPAYLLGERSRAGWWYYFPLVFLIKTPLATLFLLLVGLAILVKRKQYGWQMMWPLLLAALIFAAGLISNVNVGYRYLLPMLPFLFVVLGQLAVPGYVRRSVVWAALLLLVCASLWAHPTYLSYFNLLAGGPDNGWKMAADSNIDWGQDIQRLGQYLAAEKIEGVNIDYFGDTLLSAYGVNGRDLSLLGQTETQNDDFYTDWPAPGIYVLSVTELLGVYNDFPERYQWFLKRTPDDKVGYSLFVYSVEPEGPPVSVALSGLELGQIALADYKDAFASNDVRVSQFDARTSLLWPAGHASAGAVNMWTAVSANSKPQHPSLQALYNLASESVSATTADEDQAASFQLKRWPLSPLSQLLQSDENGRFQTEFGWSEDAVVSSLAWMEKWRHVAETAVFDETVTLLAYEVLGDEISNLSQPLEIMTYWQVKESPEADLKIFLHLIDEQGQVVAQYDGLGVHSASLRSGDEFAQLHTISLPAELPPGSYGLQLGVYNATTGERLPIPTGGQLADRLLLSPILIGKNDLPQE